MKSVGFLAMQNPLRQNVIQEDPNASKGESCHAGEHDEDSAQQENVHQQVRQIIFLALIGVLVPGDVGFVVHRTQQRARFSGRNRAGRDHDDGTGALVEDRPCSRGRTSGLRLRVGLVGRINPSQMFGRQLRRRILQSASGWRCPSEVW